MHPTDLLVRCLMWREGGQWVGICLDFDLAAQDDTQQGLRQKLSAQIKEYVRDALTGPDMEHAPRLLKRRAPLKYWLRYGVAKLRAELRSRKNGNPVALVEPLRLKPA